MSEELEELQKIQFQFEQETVNKGQLEELRKKVSELTKDEIERIEVLVNDFSE